MQDLLVLLQVEDIMVVEMPIQGMNIVVVAAVLLILQKFLGYLQAVLAIMEPICIWLLAVVAVDMDVVIGVMVVMVVDYMV